MTLTKQGNFTFNHVDQQDDIYKVKSATDIKQAYDSRANELKVTFNNLIDALKSSTAGDSGAKSIGVETISGLSGNDVQALLQALKNQIDSTVLGNVPDGSITDQKLSVSSSSPVRFGVATGTANTYAVTLTPAPTGYFDGMAVSVKINVDATAASTLNVNSLGAKGLKKANGLDFTNAKTNGVYTFRYNATTQNFILQGEGGSGTATAGDILSGKTASTDTGDITGTMVDRGAMTINAGSTDQIIPAGKHNGSGTVPAVVVPAANVLTGTTIAGTPGTMPNNSAETKALSTLPLQNIIQNGSFENGATGWTANGNPSVVSTASKFGTQSMYQNNTGAAGAYYSQSFNTVLNHKFYYAAWCKNTSNQSVNCDIGSYGVTSLTFASGSSQFIFSSALFTCSDSASHSLNVGFSGAANNGAGVWLDGVLMVDLTATFGAGNEPTNAQMDAIINALGGWLDGSSIISKIPNGAYVTNGATGNPDILINDPNFIAANIKNSVNMFGLVGTYNAKSSGTANSSNASTTSTKLDQSGTSASTTTYALSVSGLPFTPTMILAFYDSSVTDFVLYRNDWSYQFATTTNSIQATWRITNNYSVTGGSFTLQTLSQNRSYYWIAIA